MNPIIQKLIEANIEYIEAENFEKIVLKNVKFEKLLISDASTFN